MFEPLPAALAAQRSSVAPQRSTAAPKTSKQGSQLTGAMFTGGMLFGPFASKQSHSASQCPQPGSQLKVTSHSHEVPAGLQMAKQFPHS